jgi:hypothetical protein
MIANLIAISSGQNTNLNLPVKDKVVAAGYLSR